jgi:hypothetical protein
MITLGNQLVQAFPVHENTVVGTLTDHKGGYLLHAAEDVTATFNFANGATVVLDIPAGMDVALDPDITGITTTGTVWIS